MIKHLIKNEKGFKAGEMATTISKHRDRIERHLNSLGYTLAWEGMSDFVIRWDEQNTKTERNG